MAAKQTVAVLFILASVSSAACHATIPRHISVPNLLIDIFQTDMVSKCHLEKVAASVAISSEIEPNGQLRLTYNVTAYAPLSAGHLVLQVDPSSLNALPCEPLQASIDGSPVTLRTFTVNTSLVAKLDYTRLDGTVDIRLNSQQLAQCGVLSDEIFLMSNVEDNCDGWQLLRSHRAGRFSRSVKVVKDRAGGKTNSQDANAKLSGRTKVSTLLSDLIRWPVDKRTIRRDTRARTRCHREDFIVSFQELSYSSNFVSFPDSFNMGMCKGSCSTIQCKNNNAFLRGLINDMALDEEKASRELPQLPACRPTKFDDLQMIVSQEDGLGFEVRLLANMIVTECGCL